MGIICASTEKLRQLEIYFLFMHADGEYSPTETKYLNEIVEKENLTNGELQEFQAFCGKMMLRLSTGTSKTVIAEIDELLGEKHSAWASIPGSIDHDKKLQAQTIWTLINLGYADSEYSEAEKQVVNYLAERWEMNPVLIAELHDTANTILALTSQKQWIQTSSRPYAVINSTIQEIDRNIASMFANMEISILEADIV